MTDDIPCACGPAEPFDLAAWWRVGVGILIAANSMTVSLAVNTSEIGTREAAIVHGVLAGLAVLGLVLLGWPLLRNTLAAIRSRRVTLEALFIAGVIGAFTASTVAALTGHGDVYFEIVSILLVVYAFGQQVTTGAQDRALSATREWAPESTVCRRHDGRGGVETVPLSEIRPGDLMRVDPGETIPVDGVIDTGSAWVREAELTGEGFASVRRAGDQVWAGTHPLDASLDVRAIKVGGERRIDAIIDAIEHARCQPTSWQNRADRLVAVFLPLVLVISALTFVGWTASEGWPVGLFNAMAVLLVACPCALGLATPLAAWAALGRLASRGLVARTGSVIEDLETVDVAIFDKTGTLTESQLSLLDLVTAGGADDRLKIKSAIQAVEGASRHPIASAFRTLTSDEPPVLETTLLPGVGISGRLDADDGRRETWAIGDPDGLGMIDDPDWQELASRLDAPRAVRRLVVLREGRPVAAAAIDEPRRRGWDGTLAALTELGLTTEVLTGDRAERAMSFRADRVLAGLDPDDKLAEVETHRNAGRRVVFVGDGVNDAAAMAAAKIGVAVAEGAELALDVAELSWHGGDLRALPWAIELARRTAATIRSNLIVALAYNTVGIGLAVAGILHPVAATVLMTCSSLIVTWRAIGVLDDEQREVEAAAVTRQAERFAEDSP